MSLKPLDAMLGRWFQNNAKKYHNRHKATKKQATVGRPLGDPEQGSQDQRKGPRALMLAVVQTAVQDKDWEWLLDEDDGYIFSFRSICRELDLDEEYVRRVIQDRSV